MQRQACGVSNRGKSPGRGWRTHPPRTPIAESDAGLTRWEMQRDVWLEMTAASVATGCPPPPPLPPRPHHWVDDLPEDVRRWYWEQEEMGGG